MLVYTPNPGLIARLRDIPAINLFAFEPKAAGISFPAQLAQRKLEASGAALPASSTSVSQAPCACFFS
jgi:hypothetical protein